MTPIPVVTSVFLSLASFVKFALPSIEKSEWTNVNDELSAVLDPINERICHARHPDEITVAAEQFNIAVREFLLQNDLFEVVEPKKAKEFVKRQPAALAEAVKLKKELSRKARQPGASQEDHKKLRLCLRAISDMKKAERDRQRLKTAHHQEKLYFKNKWEFARHAANGTLEKIAQTATFSKEQGDQHYTNTYGESTELNLNNLQWFPTLPTSPASPDFLPFNMDPIRPRDILEALKCSNQSAAPGPDGITFGALLKLRATHKPLATLYSKILSSGAAPGPSLLGGGSH